MFFIKMNMTPRAKKLLAGLTAAALTLSMLPATALAAKDYATGGETALRFSNSGMGDNTLAPRGTATRGQAAVILMGLDKLAGL